MMIYSSISQSVLLILFQAIVELKGSKELNMVIRKGTVSILMNALKSEISNNVVCATSKASDQPAHTRSLIRAFAGHLIIL